MPELAEVEIIRRNVERWWSGRDVVDVRVLDPKILKNASVLELEEALKKKLIGMRRRGKYLWAELAGGQAVVFHFRMTGKLICSDIPEPRFARLVWRINGVGWLIFKDQRRLGEVWLLEPGELSRYRPIVEMGPEPEDLTAERLKEACSGRRMLKSALLDQRIVAGVGNIAISELFWRLRLRPAVRCGELSVLDWEALVEEMPRYFDEILVRSDSAEVHYFGESGAENIFDVYARAGEPCPICGGMIEKTKVAGRTSYFCPECQG